MSSLNPRKIDQWRFTYETLAHIPTLRLYLFKPSFSPSARCVGVKADLQLGRSLLVVSWIDSVNDEEVSIRVPVPRVLMDPGAGVEIVARVDCIEVKMRMVLPVDHPVVARLRGMLGSDEDSDRFRPLELGSDLKNLSCGDVHLFCRACSTRLTRKPLRRFMEMPSVDWREVADNWFGACCCSFGGISEKLVLQYMKTYHCAEGTGLLDSAAVIISKNDLESYVFQQYSDGKSERSNEVDTEINSEHRDAIRETCQNATEEICDTCALACSDDKVGTKVPDHETEPSSYGNHGNHVASLDLSANCSVSVRGHDSGFDEISRLAQFGLNGTHGTVVADSVKLNHWSTTPREPNQESSADQCHCCFDEASHVAEDSRPGKIRKWLHDCSLGSGFTNKTSNLSNDVEWAEFLCNNCTSVIGAYPSYKSRNEPVDGGIRLFKCYISTSISVDGPNDIFRKYTLEKVFVNLLLEGANEELSYRIIVRDLRTKSAILQIALLNSESWSSTGYCLENVTTDPLPQVDLRPVVKVLFADCSTDAEASSRITKDWSSKTHTDDVYMMKHQIEELMRCLKSAAEILPTSYSCVQGMSVSSMER